MVRLLEFMGKNNGCQVIVPPEALSFRQELNNRGMWVMNADNEVPPGRDDDGEEA